METNWYRVHRKEEEIMCVMGITGFPRCFLTLLLLFFSHPLAGGFDVDGSISSTSSVFSRLDFPPGFVFGAGSSAYQVEGAAAEDGRKPSIWDTFTHDGRTLDKATGDIASDQYHKYKDDVKLMHKMGLDAYRFSISWSRIIPDGRGAVNPKGMEYYNNLINELVSYGIEAHVTLSHFDMPQALEDEYGGYLSPKLIEDFSAYADVCFKEYGDRVKSWMTFNEPNIQSVFGSDFGIMPPGRCSYPFGFDMNHPFAFGINCSMGDSTTEPYIATHNILLSHAAAVNLYRTKYQEKQKGQIGITLLAYWFEPNSSSPLDIAATKRAVDFHLGWYLEPLVYGRYPSIMRKIVGSRLPIFTKNDLKQLKGSFDFIGLNYYCTVFVQDLQRTSDGYGSDYFGDASIKVSLGNVTLVTDFTRLDDDMASVAGEGLQRLLEYVKLEFKNPAVAIHENGIPIASKDSSNPATEDSSRITYLLRIIKSLLSSMRKGSDVRGYFVWTFVDCLEAFGGYKTNYGLYAVNFSDEGRRRYPRQSAHWYSTFLAKTGLKTKTSNHSYVD